MTNPYFEQQILGAEPTQLVLLLYKRAIASVRDARKNLGASKIAERNRHISNAYQVLVELIASLRMEVAPDLAGRLRELYFYLQDRLITANFQQVDAPLAEVHQLLTVLAEPWHQIAGTTRNEPREAAGKWHVPSQVSQAGQHSLNA